MLMAVCHGGLLSILEKVLPGSDIDAAVVNTHATQAAFTALMYACQNGHEQCARTLIKAGARKDATAKAGSTALSLARSNGHTALCELLER